MKRINIVKKITVSAGLLAAVMLLVTGVTYALLKTRTNAVDNVFKGACVNIGIVEKNKNKEMILEDSNNSNVYERISENMRTVAKEVAVKNITSQDIPEYLKGVSSTSSNHLGKSPTMGGAERIKRVESSLSTIISPGKSNEDSGNI